MKVFVEEQRFKRWILISVMVIPLVAGIVPLILAENEIPEFNSEGFWGLTITFSIMALVFILILSVRLRTKIDEQGVYYRFFPNNFSEKFIPWHVIDNIYIKKSKSGFFGSGGYGYRMCFFGKRGLIMNLGGQFGIQLELKSGKKILIGTQKQPEAEQVLNTYKQKTQSNDEMQ
ncbi:MAG: hypothetical protein PSN34_05020 [Urechidicola sp.]|nr:hypothetical protein [Urechidicola sp.]